jgi:hypothetical protein
MKLAILAVLALLLLGCSGVNGTPQANSTPAPQPQPSNFTLHVAYFYGATCQYSAKASPVVDQLEQAYSRKGVKIDRYEVWFDADNKILYDKMADAYNISPSNRGVPVAYIDGEYLMGYQRINQYLEQEINACLKAKCPNPLDAPNNPSIAKPI